MRIRVKKRKERTFGSFSRLVKGLLLKNFTLIVVFLFTIILSVALVKLYHFCKSSPYFSVKRINVFGTRYSFADDIIDLSGIRIGDNIFSFSSDKVAEQIQNHPWVKKVVVKKHLPDWVSIDVTEYNPVMFINFSDLFILDDSGVAFKKLESGELFDFPIISGIPKEQYFNDDYREYYRQKILLMYELRSRFEKAFPDIAISEIVFEKDEDITLISSKSGIEIRMGKGNFDKKLQILSITLNGAKNYGINPEIVYLDVNREGIYTMKVRGKKQFLKEGNYGQEGKFNFSD